MVDDSEDMRGTGLRVSLRLAEDVRAGVSLTLDERGELRLRQTDEPCFTWAPYDMRAGDVLRVTLYEF